MAKSGMFLHGRELLECELGKLDKADRAQMTAETNMKIMLESHRAVWSDFGSRKSRTTTQPSASTFDASVEPAGCLPAPADIAPSKMTTAIAGLILSPLIGWCLYQVTGYAGIAAGVLLGVVSLIYLVLNVRAGK